MELYPPNGRATQGVQTIDPYADDITGKIAAARMVQPGDDVSLISASGIVIRIKADDISQMGRATRGVKVMELGEGDTVRALARIAAADIPPEEPEETPANGADEIITTAADTDNRAPSSTTQQDDSPAVNLPPED